MFNLSKSLEHNQLYFCCMSSMTKVIAFAWIHGTGKTVAVETLKEKLLTQNFTVFVLQESAPFFKKYMQKDPMLFQSYINKMEICRMEYLLSLKANNLFDYILVNRTPKDNIAYTKFLQKSWAIDPDFLSADTDDCPYDKIIFYSTPIEAGAWEEEIMLTTELKEAIAEYETEIIYLENFKANPQETIQEVIKNYL